MRRAGCTAAVIAMLLIGAVSAAASSSADPYCTGSYGGAAPRTAQALRFGVDPGLAGSAGGAQLPSVPDDPAKDRCPESGQVRRVFEAT